MMFITSYCQIKNRSLIVRGKVIHQQMSGRIDGFLEDAYLFLELSYPKFYKMDRLSKLGVLASELLFRDSPITKRYPHDEIGLVLSNAHSSLDSDLRYLESVKTIASPALFVYTLPNIVAGEICIRHGIKGENAFFITSQFDAALLTDYVSMVLASEKSQVCIAGWVDLMDEHHDVFLYLVEKKGDGAAPMHTAENLNKIYQLNYGTVDGRS